MQGICHRQISDLIPFATSSSPLRPNTLAETSTRSQWQACDKANTSHVASFLNISPPPPPHTNGAASKPDQSRSESERRTVHSERQTPENKNVKSRRTERRVDPLTPGRWEVSYAVGRGGRGDVYSSRWWQLTTATGAFTPAASLWVIAHQLRMCVCTHVCKIRWVWARLWATCKKCDFIHGAQYMCLHVYLLWHECVPACVCVISMCVCYCCSSCSAHSIPVALGWNKTTLSPIKVKKKERRRAVSLAIRLQVSEPHFLPRSPSLASPFRSSHCSKNHSRGSFRWRCLPPTRATLTFERNSEQWKGEEGRGGKVEDAPARVVAFQPKDRGRGRSQIREEEQREWVWRLTENQLNPLPPSLPPSISPFLPSWLHPPCRQIGSQEKPLSQAQTSASERGNPSGWLIQQQQQQQQGQRAKKMVWPCVPSD